MHHQTPGLRVALVYPPYGPVKNEPGIKAVKENYGIFPSLSLLYVAGILEHAGCEVLFIDAHAEGLSIEETTARLQAFDPAFIGYTITTYLFFQTLDWIKAIKNIVPVPTIVGGVHLSIYPTETLHHAAIDYAVTGEAEISLPELLHTLRRGGDLRDVRGVAFRVGGSNEVDSFASSYISKFQAATAITCCNGQCKPRRDGDERP